MNIRFKKISSRYAFDILDDDSRIIYASNIHYFLTPYVSPDYKYAWEACRDSHKLLFKHPHHLFANRDDMTTPVIIDISTEQMLVNHYMDVYEGLQDQAQGMGSDAKERDFLFKSIKIVEGELEKILETLKDGKGKRPIRVILSRFKKLLKKYFRQEENKEEREKVNQNINIATSLGSLNKVANKIDDCIKKDIIEDYAQKICQTIQDKHPDCYYDLYLNKIKIMDEKNDAILEVSVNGDLNINSIVPCGSLRKIYAFYSDCFYQKYWKPIVETIGHLIIGNPKILIVPDVTILPDAPKNGNKFRINGWNISEQKEQPLEIVFNKGIWSIHLSQIKTASRTISEYTEQDYVNAIVKCIDPKLESIYNRTGVVVNVIPHTDIIEIDVNFGRGLGTIRLTEKQIEIISV